MITQEEIEREGKYLKKVIKILKEEIDSYEEKVKFLSGNIQEQMTYAWDKTNRLSDTEFVYALANIQKRSVYAENANKKVNAYQKMLKNAYFARIDFKDSEGTLPIYIGIASLEHEDDFFVYDWRAPISSMFYNCEIGPASYTISTGEKVSGTLTLKRQYKIVGDEIKEMFDTDMQIIDNILRNILSENASSKMKNIVNTIQKEQNEIIRKNDVDILVVQGPAGSGKTSIAMHKIAYLLYAERDKINNSNVLILSPNEIFNNYISDVLPGIGEDNVVEATFLEFAKAYITEFKIASKIEDNYEIIYSSNKSNMSKFAEIAFKYSNFYQLMLTDLIEKNKLELLGLEPIEIGDTVVMSAEEMQSIASTVESNGESLYLQGKRIIEKIFLSAAVKTQKQVTLEKIKKQTLENLTKIKLKSSALYRKLYENKEDFLKFVSDELEKYGLTSQYANVDFGQIFDETSANLQKDILEFQDVTPYMYLKSQIVGITANKNLKYVLIDEAQDYSICQYKILTMMFKNSNITLLGDLNQCILPFNAYNDYEGILSTLKSYKVNATTDETILTKTYRSTYEINEFAKQVLTQNLNYTQIERHGDKVDVVYQEKFDVCKIADRAVELKSYYNTVAIICKNFEETLLYNRILNDEKYKFQFKLMTKNDNVFVEDKIMIIPSYLAKGLEFDAVLVSNANAENYNENEKNLLYVVLTRALHKLEVFYTGKITELLLGECHEK